MRLKTREACGAVIVDVNGRLVGGPDSKTFRDCIAGLLDTGRTRIIINLRGCAWANSQGIGMLIGARSNATRAGGELVLAHLTDRVHSVLAVAKLLAIFTTFGTVEDAVEYLGMLGKTPQVVPALS